MFLAATALIAAPLSQPAFAAPVIYMDDTVVGTGQNIWSGRPIQAEYVTPSSVLIGKQIDAMVIQLKKSGLPTGDAEIGVFNSDLSVKKLFATKDVSTLTGSYVSYEFVLSGTPYTIEAGDRIGVKYTGGASTEHISIMRDTDHADPFDGVNSYNSFYNSTSTTWSTFALYDLTMTLKGAPPAVSDTIPPIITAAPAGGTYNAAQSVSLSSNEPATIYYTSDGSDPVTSPTRLAYSSPIAIPESTLLKYYGIDDAGNASAPQEQNYIIQQPDTIPPIITAAPSGGTYDSAQSVVLSSNEPATIYYTSDGSDPVTSGTRLVYSSPIAISASTLLRYYGIDSVGNTSTPQEQNYIIQQQPPSPFPIIHMQDTTATVGSVTHAGRQINAEYVTPTSQLVGDKIDSITLRLQKIGSPPGTFQVGVFNTNLTVKKSFAIVSTSTLSATFQDYEFKLPNSELYTIVAGDRIGIKYNGGTTSNAISVMNDRDPADPFDSDKSYRTRYESFWIVSYGEDMYMTLKQTHAGTGTGDTIAPTVTASPPGGTYTSAQSVTLSANEPAVIYYTTNGLEPTISSSVYSGSPIPISSTTTLKFMGVDTAGNASPASTQVYTISVFSPVTHMSDTTVSFASLMSAPRQLMTEYVTPTSQLVGDKIDSITLRLQKVGSPTGTAQVGIFNTDLSVKKLFATINVATISTTATEYEFKLPAADPLYTIASGDRIGIKYTGGSAAAGINVTPDRDPANPFDGANSYRARYEAGWINSTGEDLYMILKQTHG